MIICSAVLAAMGVFLYLSGREQADKETAFTGAAVFVAGLLGILLGLLWPLACLLTLL